MNANETEQEETFIGQSQFTYASYMYIDVGVKIFHGFILTGRHKITLHLNVDMYTYNCIC